MKIKGTNTNYNKSYNKNTYSNNYNNTRINSVETYDVEEALVGKGKSKSKSKSTYKTNNIIRGINKNIKKVTNNFKSNNKSKSKSKTNTKANTKKKSTYNYPTNPSVAKKRIEQDATILYRKKQYKGNWTSSGVKFDGHHYYETFHCKDINGNTHDYNVRLNSKGSTEVVVASTNNKNGTYTHINRDAKIYETKDSKGIVTRWKYVNGQKTSILSVKKHGGSTSFSTNNKSTNKQNNSASSSKSSNKAQSIINEATKYVGHTYTWGGNNLLGTKGGKYGNGIDCSHFVNRILNNVGIKIGYLTSGGWNNGGAGKRFTKVSGGAKAAKPGDIICFNGHVAFLGNGGNLIEAQSSKAGITKNRKMNAKNVTAVYRYTG